MRNPKTTGLGIGSLLIVIGGVLQQYFGGGEITGADISTAISAIVSAIGLIFAKDAAPQG